MDTANFLNNASVFLVGMMGAGKSATGQSLARRLGYRFLDTDALIEQAAGVSIPELFATQGEAAFRQLETQVLGEVAAYTRVVTATGGGIVLNDKNWSYLHHGIVIWLDAPLEVLRQRLAGDQQRPLLQGPEGLTKLQHLLEQRRSRYELADIQVAITPQDTVDAVSDRLLELLRQTVKANQQTGAEG